MSDADIRNGVRALEHIRGARDVRLRRRVNGLLRGGDAPSAPPCKAHRVVAPQTLRDMLAEGTATVVCAFKDHDEPLIATSPASGATRVSLSRADFERLPADKVRPVVIVYCAAWSCDAAERYCAELREKHPGRVIVDYKGGLCEWAALHLASDERQYAFKKDPSQSVASILAKNQHVYHMKHHTNATRLLACAHALRGGADGGISPTPALFEDRTGLEGKNVVVTGATKGVGMACAWACALRGAAHVTMTSRGKTVPKQGCVRLAEQLTQEARRRGLNVVFTWQRADARRAEDNARTLGPRRGVLPTPVHCAVLNAGVFGAATGSHKLEEITKPMVEGVMQTNATGVMLGLQAFVRQLPADADFSPAAVGIASIYGSSGSRFSHIAYQMSKGACKLAMKQAAIELARPSDSAPRVRCNTVSPTFLSTNLTKQFFEDEGVRRIVQADTPTGRWGEVRSVAATVAFLLSDAAESITGVDIPVDEGVLAESVPGVEAAAQIDELGDYRCCGTEADAPLEAGAS